MPKTKRLVRISIVVITVIVALIVLSALLIHTPPVKEFVRMQVEAYIRRNLGSETSIERFDYSLGRGVLSFDGVVLRSGQLPESRPFLRIGHGSVRFAPVSLVSGIVSVNSVQLEHVNVDILVHPDGGTNLPEEIKMRPGGTKLLVDNVDIKKAGINIEDGRQKIILRLPSCELGMQGKPAEGKHDLSLQTRQRGMVSYQDRRFDITNLSLEAELLDDALRIAHLDIAATGSNARGTGVIRNLSNPVVNVTLDTAIDLGEAAAIAGLAPGVQGKAQGSLSITGPPERLHISGTLGVDDVGPRP